MDIQKSLEHMQYMQSLIDIFTRQLEEDRALYLSFPSILAEVERDTLEHIGRLERQKGELVSLINELDEPDMQIMLERYLNGKKWDEVAHDVGYSKSQVFERHKNALNFLKSRKC